MKNMNKKLSKIIRFLLIVIMVSGIVNKYMGKGDALYYITEIICGSSAVMTFILAVIKDEIKDCIFQEEWA